MSHWREEINTLLLGAYSLDDGNDGYLEVDGVLTYFEKADYVMGASGKQKIFVAHTSLGKPIKVNVTIGKSIAAIAGTNNRDKWKDIPCTFYVDRNVKFGKETVEAIRVKKRKYVAPIDYSKQIAAINACTTLDEMKTVYTAFTKDEQLATKSAKDAMKTKLTPTE